MADAVSKMPDVQTRDGTQELNFFKKLAQFFQFVIRFHPGHQQPKSCTCSRGIVVRKVILNRTEPLFQGFLSFQCVFVLK